MSTFTASGKRTAKKTKLRKKRHLRVRKRISGDSQMPRLVVTRSLRHMTAQIVDDTIGKTLVSASTMEADLRKAASKKTDLAFEVGKLVASRAKAAGITKVVFDRAGNRYHGRVAAVADGARDAGLAL